MTVRLFSIFKVKRIGASRFKLLLLIISCFFFLLYINATTLFGFNLSFVYVDWDSAKTKCENNLNLNYVEFRKPAGFHADSYGHINLKLMYPGGDLNACSGQNDHILTLRGVTHSLAWKGISNRCDVEAERENVFIVRPVETDMSKALGYCSVNILAYYPTMIESFHHGAFILSMDSNNLSEDQMNSAFVLGSHISVSRKRYEYVSQFSQNDYRPRLRYDIELYNTQAERILEILNISLSLFMGLLLPRLFFSKAERKE